MDKQKVIVYVDGFNFYYGLRKNRWRKYYWLDMVRLFESFMRLNQELVAVKYFSARVEDDGKSLRQNAFFQANQMNPKFKLILGKYLRKTFKCKECGFLNDTYEEKESDVRIGMERYESRFRNSLLPDTVTLRDGYELTIPEKWKAYQTM